MPNNPKLFTLDKTTEEILKEQKNQSKYVREAIKFFYSHEDIEIPKINNKKPTAEVIWNA